MVTCVLDWLRAPLAAEWMSRTLTIDEENHLARLDLLADWPESAGRSSNTSGAGLVGMGARGIVCSWSELSSGDVARPKVWHRPD